MEYRAWLSLLLLPIIAVRLANGADLRLKYIGRSSCAPELKATRQYGIRLDRKQNAYLYAHKLSEGNVLASVQYTGQNEHCGLIRDLVQSRDNESSFVWECIDPTSKSDVIVGTWAANHVPATGRSEEAWKVDIASLTFHRLKKSVSCSAGNYAGTDQGEGSPTGQRSAAQALLTLVIGVSRSSQWQANII
jgi:hypothetical protein